MNVREDLLGAAQIRCDRVGGYPEGLPYLREEGTGMGGGTLGGKEWEGCQ